MEGHFYIWCNRMIREIKIGYIKEERQAHRSLESKLAKMLNTIVCEN